MTTTAPLSDDNDDELEADDGLEPIEVGRTAKELGATLRGLRQRRGLSLQGVEEESGGKWKAVVVGSYERGDRRPTAVRIADYLAWLADCRLMAVPASHVYAQADTLLMIDILNASRRAIEARAVDIDAGIELLIESVKS